jgi:tRNA (mo5U34)-methyltransferase
MTRVFDSDAVAQALRAAGAGTWADWLAAQDPARFDERANADLPRWQATIDALPGIAAPDVDLTADRVRIGSAAQLNDRERADFIATLMQLHPWRKGPFELFGVHIDTEWRSDRKWQRVAPHLSPLAGRTVLDVGCGNGYYLCRMLGTGAARVIGIEPMLQYLAQFAVLKNWLPDAPAHILPARLEELPAGQGNFDTVFSMGVLYHRRDADAHLAELRAALRAGGELVLETLVLADDEDGLLQPPGRYAQMRNVFAIPGTARLARQVADAGFADVRVVDVSPTTTAEQRRTDWMTFQSLADFLDSADPSRTLEGHPAPVRAVVIAQKPA